MKKYNCYIDNIHHGDKAKGRDKYIYATLRDFETGELMISATLDYIIKAVKERGYNLKKRNP